MTVKDQTRNGDQSPRGLIYFCEETLCYHKGLKAWIFFGPYLLGAIWLESEWWKGTAFSGTWLSIFLMIYLLIFPAAWRRILIKIGLLKRKRAS